MINKIKITVFLALCLVIKCTYAKFTAKKQSKEVKALVKSGLHVDYGTRMMLNKFMKKNKSKNKSFYEVSFVCEHDAKGDVDKCGFSDLNYKKNKN